MCQTTKKLFFIGCFTLWSLCSWGQNEIHFESISTCAVLEASSSIEATRKKAIQALKVKALQDAGVAELITSNQYLEVNNNEVSNTDKYYESTFSDLRGEVSAFSLLKFTQSIGEGGEILICAHANVSVIKYEELERVGPKFQVLGLQNRYKSLERLSFNLSVNQDGYFWVFLIDDQENYSLLYPTNQNHDNFILKDNSKLLPGSTVYWQLNTNGKAEEKNALLVVGHHENIPINAKAISDFNDWAKWYKELDYIKKSKQIFNFIIYRP